MSRIVDIESLGCLAWKDGEHGTTFDDGVLWVLEKISELPAVQPQYEELTPEEAASEIASGSIMSAWYRLDAMIQLKQMGYVICRKR